MWFIMVYTLIANEYASLLFSQAMFFSLLLHVELLKGMSEAKFRRRTSHEPNRMQIRENKGFCSFAFDSAHVKYGV